MRKAWPRARSAFARSDRRGPKGIERQRRACRGVPGISTLVHGAAAVNAGLSAIRAKMKRDGHFTTKAGIVAGASVGRGGAQTDRTRLLPFELLQASNERIILASRPEMGGLSVRGRCACGYRNQAATVQAGGELRDLILHMRDKLR